MGTQKINRPIVEMLIATMLWGFGFIGAQWALPGMGPIFITGARFAIAVLILLAIKPVKFRIRGFKAMFIPGFLLCLTLVVQTWGLRYTTPTRSGFITVLYVLFIPLFERIFFRVRANRSLWFWIFVALIGTGLICGALTLTGVSPEMMKSFNLGDWLTLVCAISAAAHFISVEKFLSKAESPFHFHLYQSIWVILFCAILVPFIEGAHEFHFPWSPLVWAGVIELGIFSSAIAFWLQIRSQQTMRPATVGILSLLESPWAMVFSIALGYEIMTGDQLVGAALILLAASGETLLARTKQRA